MTRKEIGNIVMSRRLNKALESMQLNLNIVYLFIDYIVEEPRANENKIAS